MARAYYACYTCTVPTQKVLRSAWVIDILVWKKILHTAKCFHFYRECVWGIFMFTWFYWKYTHCLSGGKKKRPFVNFTDMAGLSILCWPVPLAFHTIPHKRCRYLSYFFPNRFDQLAVLLLLDYYESVQFASSIGFIALQFLVKIWPTKFADFNLIRQSEESKNTGFASKAWT